MRIPSFAAVVLLLPLIAAAGVASPGEAVGRCRGAVGVWSWFNGLTVEIDADGVAFAMRGPEGPEENFGLWWCTDAKAGRIEIVWEEGGWVDTLTLSDDGRRLSGRNQLGGRVTATLGGAPR